MTLQFKRVSTHHISFSNELGAGLHLLLGQQQDGVLDLLMLACGDQAPKSGIVTLEGKPPLASPDVRKRTAAAYIEEWPTAKVSIEQQLKQAAQLGSVRLETALAYLAEWGLSHVLDAPCDTLATEIRRTAALAAALSCDNPRLLALWDPLQLPFVPRQWLIDQLKSRAQQQIVLIATPDLSTALELGGALYVFKNGQLLHALSEQNSLDSAFPEISKQLLITSPSATELQQRAVGARGVQRAELESPTVIRVTAVDLTEASLSMMQLAVKYGLSVEAIDTEPVSLETAQALASGYQQAAHSAVLEAARAQQLQAVSFGTWGSPQAPSGPAPPPTNSAHSLTPMATQPTAPSAETALGTEATNASATGPTSYHPRTITEPAPAHGSTSNQQPFQGASSESAPSVAASPSEETKQ